MAYTKTTWINDTSPAISAENLNKIEQGIYDAHSDISDLDVVGEYEAKQRDFMLNNNRITFTYGGYIFHGTGETLDNIKSSDEWKYAIVSCSPDDVFTVNGCATSSRYAWVFYASDRTTKVAWSRTDAKTENLILRTPSGAAYLGINERVTQYTLSDGTTKVMDRDSYYGILPNNEVKNMASEQDSILALDDETEIHYEIANTGVVRYGNGNIDDSSSLSHTDYIDVSKYRKIKFSCVDYSGISNTNTGMCFYDESKNAIFGVQCLFESNPAQYTDMMVNVPLTAKYARFTTFTNTLTYGDFSIKSVKSNLDIALNTEEKRVDDIIGNNLIPIEHGYILNNNSTVDFEEDLRTSTTSVHSVVPCKQGDVFIINADGGTSSKRIWAFYDSSYNLLSNASSSAVANNLRLIAPRNSAYLIINAPDSSYRSFYGDTYKRENVLPDYYFENKYMLERLEEIRSHHEDMGINGDEFIWITDMHLWRNDINSTENGLQSVKLIKYILDRTGIGKVVYGGDSLSGADIEKQDAFWMLGEFRKHISQICRETYMIIGNHEWNNPGATQAGEVNELSLGDVYSLFPMGREEEYGSISPKGDYWIDNKVKGIRYFFIHCTRGSILFDESVAWLGEQLSDVPNGYTVVVLSHIGINSSEQTIVSSFQNVADLLDALKSGGTKTISGVTYDYTGKDVDVACIISGHVHVDLCVYTTGGIPVIASTCDRGRISSSSDLFKAVRRSKTIGEQAFDVVQIDKTNKKIYLTRIGGSTIGASYDSETGKVYDTAVGTGTEYTGTEWILASTHKDREFTYPTGSVNVLTNTAPYVYRQIPVNNNFNTSLKKIIGGSVVWNQFTYNGNFSDGTTGWAVTGGTMSASNNVLSVDGNTSTFIAVNVGTGYRTNSVVGHKYLLALNVKCSSNKVYLVPTGSASDGRFIMDNVLSDIRCSFIWNCTVSKSITYTVRFLSAVEGTAENIHAEIHDLIAIDLTAMFGSTIADYVNTLETTEAGSGIAWLQSYNFLTKLYYAYQTGKLESVRISGRKVIINSNTETIYPTSPIILRGKPYLDNGELKYDGDEYNADGSVTRNYEERAYQSGDENLSNAITDKTNTVIKLVTSTTETANAFTKTQVGGSAEEFMDYEVAQSNRDVAIPVEHETDYYGETN